MRRAPSPDTDERATVVSVLRYHEISESRSRILNPFSEAKLDALGTICSLHPGQRHLDLACGKGEMLCRYARDHGVTGVGIDVHPPFLDDARARAAELGVDAQLRFVAGDAGHPDGVGDHFDIVSCIGATWIGGGLSGSLDLMRRLARPGGWLLVGEVYWTEEPSPETRAAEEATQTFADLSGTLDRIEAAGLELVEMILASPDDWDRYTARQWITVSDWLADHPDDPDAPEIRRINAEGRHHYLADRRRSMGWGVFVLRDAHRP